MVSERVLLLILREPMFKLNSVVIALLLIGVSPLLIGCGLVLGKNVQTVYYGTAFESRFCLNRGEVLLLVGNKTVITDTDVKDDYSNSKELYDFFYKEAYKAFSKNKFGHNYRVNSSPSSYFDELYNGDEDPEDLLVRHLEELEKRYTSVLLIDDIFYSDFSSTEMVQKTYLQPGFNNNLGMHGTQPGFNNSLGMHGTYQTEEKVKFSKIQVRYKIISLEQGHDVSEFSTEVRGGFESSFKESLIVAYNFVTYDKSK